VNLKAHHASIEQDMNVKWLPNTCISHCTNNAWDKANFPMFATLWSLLVKVFSPDAAKIVWEKRMECAWLSHSSTRWFSKHDVVERLFKHFDDDEKLPEMLKSGKSTCKTGGRHHVRGLGLDSAHHGPGQVQGSCFVQ
jgi:hypothetical protein